MKNIKLIRHAKSSWDLSVSDFERTITQKGIDNSYKSAGITKSFLSKDYLIYSSPASRAIETAKIFLKNWNIPINELIIIAELYTFSLSNLEQIVKSCPNDCDSLILFGHNNAITEFVNKFGDIYIDNVPTSGFVSISFETNNWQTINKGKTDKILFPSHL